MADPVWTRHALQWSRIGGVLRPSPEDVHEAERWVAIAAGGTEVAPHHALLLGVTEELARMRWPVGTRLTALDLSQPMIKGVWPGARIPGARALRADWQAMPLRGGSVSVMVGDGCFSTLAYPQGYAAVSDEVRRVLRPGGMLILRAFARPDAPEPLAAVVEDLHAGRIGTFHSFKWRLAMALHGDVSEGVRLGDVWDAWHRAVPDPEALSARLGWPLETVQTIDAYRGSDTRYTFPRRSEYVDLWVPAFSVECVSQGTYELADRCPRFALRRR